LPLSEDELGLRGTGDGGTELELELKAFVEIDLKDKEACNPFQTVSSKLHNSSLAGTRYLTRLSWVPKFHFCEPEV
jgi:hypothetical protein